MGLNSINGCSEYMSVLVTSFMESFTYANKIRVKENVFFKVNKLSSKALYSWVLN